jgi:hypothetical protein
MSLVPISCPPTCKRKMLLGPLHLGLIVGLKQRAESEAISDMAPRVGITTQPLRSIRAS